MNAPGTGATPGDPREPSDSTERHDPAAPHGLRSRLARAPRQEPDPRALDQLRRDLLGLGDGDVAGDAWGEELGVGLAASGAAGELRGDAAGDATRDPASDSTANPGLGRDAWSGPATPPEPPAPVRAVPVPVGSEIPGSTPWMSATARRPSSGPDRAAPQPALRGPDPAAPNRAVMGVALPGPDRAAPQPALPGQDPAAPNRAAMGVALPSLDRAAPQPAASALARSPEPDQPAPDRSPQPAAPAPTPPPTEPPDDPARGPSTIGLVRLRLALALLAAAAIPIVVALVAPMILGAGQVDQAHAAQVGGQVSAALGAELDRDHSALLLYAANTSTVRLATGAGPVSAARADLQPIASVLGDGVPVAVVTDASGTERLRMEDGQFVAAVTDPLDARVLAPTLALRPGQVYVSAPFTGPDGSPTVAMTTPLMSSGRPVGLVRFDLSLVSLLADPQSPVGRAGGYSLIVDSATGTLLADTRGAEGDSGTAGADGAGSALPSPDQVLSSFVRQAGQTVTAWLGDRWSVAYAPLDVSNPAFGDWAVVVAIPAVPVTPPLPLLTALGLLIALLLALAAWMARQVLQPAIEMDRSRRELSQRLEVAQHDALHDSLTGLGNHRAFYEELDRQLALSHRYGVACALLLIDLDDFKRVNDTAGHAAGDAVLATVGAFLARHVRATDHAFRIGGDEFAVVMPHTDAAGGLMVAQRLLAMALEPVASVAQRHAGLARPVSFSAGVSAVPVPAESRAELYAQADAALLWCKRHGRTSVAEYDPARHTLDGQDVIAELSQAVARVAADRALRPVFQPVVELVNGRVTGFEGLVRPAAGSGFDDPGSLFVAAERSGRTVELDQACLEVLAAAAVAIPADRSVSLNLSPRSLEAPEFSAHALARTLDRLGLPPERVVIELTEREAVDDMDLLRANLEACRRAGMRIAADDVGSGNAGLRLLSQIHFDIVKIDLSLVHGGAARESSLAVLRSLVDLAKHWGSVVVAEGVETPDQLRVLRSLDVTAAQGYLLGRPSDDVTVDSVDLEALLAPPPVPNLPGWASIRATPA